MNTTSIRTACLIDDDPTFIYLTDRIIKKKKLCQRLLIFENGDLAIKEFRHLLDTGADLPELVLLDINMPKMDGWQFLEEFVKIDPQLRKKITIYMVSSSINEGDINRAKGCKEITEYILKPITFATLENLFKPSDKN